MNVKHSRYRCGVPGLRLLQASTVECQKWHTPEVEEGGKPWNADHPVPNQVIVGVQWLGRT